MARKPLQAQQTLLNKVALPDPGPVHPSDRRKPGRVCCSVALDLLDSFVANLHGDVDDVLDTATIHDRQHLCWILGIEVIVVVDHREARGLDMVLSSGQHRARLKVADRKSDLRPGLNHCDELVLLRHTVLFCSLAVSLLHGRVAVIQWADRQRNTRKLTIKRKGDAF